MKIYYVFSVPIDVTNSAQSGSGTAKTMTAKGESDYYKGLKPKNKLRYKEKN